MSVRGRNEVRWWGWNGRIPVAIYSYITALAPFFAFTDENLFDKLHLWALALPITALLYYWHRNPVVNKPVSVIRLAVVSAMLAGTLVIAKLV